MKNKANPFLGLFIAAQLFISGMFIAPLLFFYEELNINSLYSVIAAIVVGSLLIYLGTKIKFSRSFGRQLLNQATAFWGIGWAIMVLFEPQVGWWIFIGGWLALTAGLFIIGTADFIIRGSVGWAFLPLLTGIIPPFVELTNPQYFATNFEPFVQLQIMFLFASGWVLQGVLLTHSELPELSQVTEATMTR